MSRKKKRSGFGSGQTYWQSYSDMMAALLLMFILIMAFTLSQSLKLYEDKIKVQEEQQELLDAQQKEIDEIIGVKMDIIQALSEVFKNSNLTIDIDEQTGAIALDSSVLFAYNSAELTPEGTQFLNHFLPLYISVLRSDTYRPYISEIIIEGHTDTSGDYMYNLNLSQRRAYTVAQYSLSGEQSIFDPVTIEDLRTIMTANGKSFSDPVYKEDGTVDAAKSRRVEIKFRLQDEEMINKLQNILEDT